LFPSFPRLDAHLPGAFPWSNTPKRPPPHSKKRLPVAAFDRACSIWYNLNMSTISLQELQQNPDILLDRVEAGEHLVVTRGGRPVAELRPFPSPRPSPRPYGLCAGAFMVPDDFDAALPEDLLREFEGR
jgi:prevent-host-death family protein